MSLGAYILTLQISVPPKLEVAESNYRIKRSGVNPHRRLMQTETLISLDVWMLGLLLAGSVSE